MNKVLATLAIRANYPAEEVARDAYQLRDALAKRFPTRTFAAVRSEKQFTVEVSGLCDGELNVKMIAFAEGFLASAHLWER